MWGTFSQLMRNSTDPVCLAQIPIWRLWCIESVLFVKFGLNLTTTALKTGNLPKTGDNDRFSNGIFLLLTPLEDDVYELFLVKFRTVLTTVALETDNLWKTGKIDRYSNEVFLKVAEVVAKVPNISLAEFDWIPSNNIGETGISLKNRQK